MRLLKLPDKVQLAIREGLISMGHARALITVESPEEQLSILSKIIKKGLSVRQVEELVKKLHAPRPTKEEEEFPEEYAQLVEMLEKLFSQEISIKKNNKGGGKIVIGFDSDEDVRTFVSSKFCFSYWTRFICINDPTAFICQICKIGCNHCFPNEFIDQYPK